MLRWLLDLERLGDDRFGAPIPLYEGRHNLFGGQVASQALRAASHTVDTDLRPHSLHAYFVRSGRLDVPLELHVDRTRDGRSFATRHVEAVQDGTSVFSLIASFQRDETGAEYQLPMASGVPDPDVLDAEPTRGTGLPSDGPLEVRTIETAAGAEPFAAAARLWVRYREPLPEDATSLACLLTFVADMRTGTAAVTAVGGSLRKIGMLTSLDHAVWFHRPAPVDGWFLLEMRPLSNAGARGLVLGSIHASDGVHVASFTQELLVRPPDARRRERP
jgi:acyl-CoA thioesterase-2